jgi:hypothetical protein
MPVLLAVVLVPEPVVDPGADVVFPAAVVGVVDVGVVVFELDPHPVTNPVAHTAATSIAFFIEASPLLERPRADTRSRKLYWTGCYPVRQTGHGLGSFLSRC